MASLCTSWLWAPPVTVAAGRPARVTLHALPCGRRPPSAAPLLRIQLGRRPRGAFVVSRCQKGADHHPDPEREREDAVPDALDIFIKDLEKHMDVERAKWGLRVPPKMFCNQNDEIWDQLKILHSKHVPPKMFGKQNDEICDQMKILRFKGASKNKMAVRVCKKARPALDLASMVMDIASLVLGTTEISRHTTDQMVRMYATIFCNAAEEACHKGVKVDTVISFLGALRCLGAIAHIMVEDSMVKLKDGPLKNKINRQLVRDYHEFSKKMNVLLLEISVAKGDDAHEIYFFVPLKFPRII